MSPEIALQQIEQAMLLVMLLSLPPIIVASMVGILVSLLQALTQVQEQTVPCWRPSATSGRPGA